MATYKTFEELPVWQHARKFCANADRLVESTDIRKSFKLRDQMLGSSGSIMDNIAEGFERSGNKEFIQFLYTAKASAGEFRSQLYRALDAGRITEEQFITIKSEVLAISKELSTFISHLENSNYRGHKYSVRQ